MSQRLFISHASEDEAVVSRIVMYLEAHGVSCWIAGRDIPPRAIYAEAITQGIQASEACAVIVSKSANASAAIKRELELASHYAKPFIPIRVDATEPGPGLDYYLRNTQWIQYGRDGDRALDRIAAHMSSGVASSYTPPPQLAEREPWPIPTKALVVVGAIAVAATAGWFVLTQLPRGETQITEVETPPAATGAVSEAPGPPTDSAVIEEARPPPAPDEEQRQYREEIERLTRERDAALEQDAARDQERRESAERAQRELDAHRTQIVGTWSGTIDNTEQIVSWILASNGVATATFATPAIGTWRRTEDGEVVVSLSGSVYRGYLGAGTLTLTGRRADGSLIRTVRLTRD